jgi:hypothetical protein
MKQTAVEWLVKKYFEDYNILISELEFQQAKEMEKQQIINFVNWCNSEDAEDLVLDLILIGELNKKPTTKELLEIYKNK